MARPKFATPQPQSCRSEILEWSFPKPYHNFTLMGKSRAAWQTSFVIPELNLLLDAGHVISKMRPKHVFLTHGHSDHTLLAPVFAERRDPPDIVCPAEMQQALDTYINAKRILNLGGVVPVGITLSEEDMAEEDEEAEEDSVDQKAKPSDPPQDIAKPSNGGDGQKVMPTHITHGIHAGDTVPLRRTPDVSATAFACDHTVPSLGYVFERTTQKLRPEYRGLPGPQLQQLRLDGVNITAPVATPLFAFLGDTKATTLAAEPSWLQGGIPVVITECSFLYEKHRAQADKTKHTIWADLEPVIRKWPRTTFVLMHFSLRYCDEEIRQFFCNMTDAPRNIVIWVDGEPEDEGK